MTHARQVVPRVRRRGFTLPELMLSVVVLSIGILAMVASMAAMMRLQRLALNRADMVSLADSKLDDLRGAATSQSADTVQLALGGSTVTSMALHADTIVGSSGRTFYRRWAVSAGPFASTRNVQLRISPDIDDRMMPAKVDLYTMILLY